MPTSRFAEFVTRQHARDFVDALVTRYDTRRCPRLPIGNMLTHDHLALREGGDLGKVRDDEHLMAFAERGEIATDSDRCRAADARVNLVEDEGLRCLGEDQP